MTKDEILNNNRRILNYLSFFLNECPKAITTKDVQKVTDDQIEEKYAYALLFAAYFDIDIYKEKEFFHNYILKMLYEEDESFYKADYYYNDIKIKNVKTKKWEIKLTKYEPYELFVRDDMEKYPNGIILPKVGFFKKPFYYYAIYENNRLWMSITPNEINTMKKDISDAFGNVLTFGLGMGYFSYMVSIKDNVNSVTIVEKDEEVISLFKKHILPLFKSKDKIKIYQSDAFEFLKKENINIYDFIFVDIWHDVSDGLPLYKRFKEYENNNKTIWRYWIEKTMKCY